MSGKLVSYILVSTLLIWASVSFNVRPAKCEETIYIRADGSIDPLTANITTSDFVNYYFTESNYVRIMVERNNIVIDGANHTLQGTESMESKGIDLSGRENITIRNTRIQGFYYGIYLFYSPKHINISGNSITSNIWYGIMTGERGVFQSMSILSAESYDFVSIYGNNISNNGKGIRFDPSCKNNSIIGNNITNNSIGIRLDTSSNNIISGNHIMGNGDAIILGYSTNNTISGNYIANNGCGTRGWEFSGDMFCHNNFINNSVYPYENYANIWDNGVEGNYWSDYNGTDSDSDGIGDIPYIIDDLNQDNCPLMSPYMPGGINHDAIVDILDVAKIAGIYGCSSGDPQWNPHCDINQDNIIDIFDLVTVAVNFGEEWASP